MIGAMSSGLSGMMAMQSKMDMHAANIARASMSMLGGSSGSTNTATSTPGSSADSADLTSNIVGTQEAVQLYKANGSTIKAEDEAIGTLLSLMA